MAVCVAGMHRSGTSMVARVLNVCGLDLGPEDELIPPAFDNRSGYWENRHVVELDDALLAATGGSWDAVPRDDDWATATALAGLQARAMDFVARFDARAAWGWKDPRASLTLSFWKRVVPRLAVVVCVRNPLEVVTSLRRRGNAVADAGLELWVAYYRRLLGALGSGDFLVTHYDAYLHDAPAEIARVAGWLGLATDGATVRRAAATVRDDLRHERATTAEALATTGVPDVAACYLELCAAAGPVLSAAQGRKPSADGRGARFVDGVLRDRIATLEGRVAARDAEIAAARDALAAREAELAARARDVAALADRQAALTGRVRALETTLAARDAAVASHAGRATALAAELARVRDSRGWRLLEWIWRLRLGVAPNGTRRERVWIGLAGRLGV